MLRYYKTLKRCFPLKYFSLIYMSTIGVTDAFLGKIFFSNLINVSGNFIGLLYLPSG